MKANCFHWHTDALSKLCKWFNILKRNEQQFWILQSLPSLLYKYSLKAESICRYSNTKIAAECNCQGISNYCMDLCWERNSMKTALLFVDKCPAFEWNRFVKLKLHSKLWENIYLFHTSATHFAANPNVMSQEMMQLHRRSLP